MQEIKTAVQSQFGAVAANYRTSKVHAIGPDLTAMAQLVAQTPNAHVLDAGCGGGHATVAVAPACNHVIALDLTPLMLDNVAQLAQERNLTNVSTREGDVEQLPFADATFDVLVSRYSAHHWPNPTAALSEFKRVLKPNGRFILSDIVGCEAPAIDTFLQAVELLRDISHVRDHTVSQWHQMLTAATFQPHLVQEWPLPITFSKWTQRINTPPANCAMLHTLLTNAVTEIRDYLQIQEDGSFTLRAALFEATLS